MYKKDPGEYNLHFLIGLQYYLKAYNGLNEISSVTLQWVLLYKQ